MANKMPDDSPISLHQALTENRCPMCFLLEEIEFEFLCQLQSNEEGSLEGRLKREEPVWLCNFHLWQFNRMAKVGTVAILVQAWLEKTLLPSHLSVHDFEQPCLACGLIEEKERQLVNDLAENLVISDFRTFFLKSDSLCMPHFKMVMSQLKNESERLFLFGCQRRGFEKLLPLVKGVISRRFWDTSSEERNAVPRGIEKLVGMKGRSCK